MSGLMKVMLIWVEPEYVSGIAPETVFNYLAVILGIVFLAVIGFTIWNMTYKREAKRKTAAL